MHKWERIGRPLIPVVAATMLISCGGGGSSLTGTSVTGVSDSQFTLSFSQQSTTDTGLLAATGALEVLVTLKDSSGKPLANNALTLNLSGGSPVTLDSNSISTDSTGQAKVTLKANGASVGSQGQVTINYVDADNRKASKVFYYKVVGDTSLTSSLVVSQLLCASYDPAKFDLAQGQCSTDKSIGTLSSLSSAGSNTEADLVLAVKDKLSDKAVSGQSIVLMLPTNVVFTQGGQKVAAGSYSGTTNEKGVLVLHVSAADQDAGNISVSGSLVDVNGVSTALAGIYKIISNLNVFLGTDSSSLASGDTTKTVTLTASVTDVNRKAKSNQAVTFSIATPGATCGSQKIPSSAGSTVVLGPDVGIFVSSSNITDANGQAVAKLQLTAADRKGNYQLPVQVSVGGGSNECTYQLINVTGTSLKLSADSTTIATGKKATVKASLLDSLGKPITDACIVFSATSSSSCLKVDSNGQASYITPALSSQTTVTATPYVASGGDSIADSQSLTLAVSSTPLVVTPSITSINVVDDKDLYGNAESVLAISAPSAANATVNVATTLGTLTQVDKTSNTGSSISVKLDSAGAARVKLTSTIAGKAVVNVQADVGSQTQEVQVVSNQAATIVLKSNQTSLKPQGQAKLTATLRDKNNSPVKGIVTFTAPSGFGDLSSPSVVTDAASGEASVVFTAGTTTSPADGVMVTAQIKDSNNVAKIASTKLSIGGQAVFISLGTGNVLKVHGDIAYDLPYQVMVVDATGSPIADARVSISVYPIEYRKGVYSFLDPVWTPTISSTCTAEDVTFELGSGDDLKKVLNGILDTGEDINGNGELTPVNVVSYSNSSGTSEVTTDSTGIANINITYARKFAIWTKVRLIATTLVNGSEGRTKDEFILPVLADDIKKKDTSPPGQPSPFGTADKCTNAN